MLKIKSILRNFFNHATMKWQLGEQLNNEMVAGGHFAVFTSGKFTFIVQYDDFLLYGLFKKYKIKVEDITIYENGWNHKVSKEMKKELKKALENIQKFNQQCFKEDLPKKFQTRLNKGKMIIKKHEQLEHKIEKELLETVFK